MSNTPQHLRIALCLYPNLTALDYQGPIELFGFFTPNGVALQPMQDLYAEYSIPYVFDLEYLSHDMNPVKPFAGPPSAPQKTYDEALEQYDILVIPGGSRIEYAGC